MADTIREYRFIPLSPVHIGSGETLAPENYALSPDGEELIAIDTRALVRKLPDQGRQAYEDLLEAGNLAGALNFIRGVFAGLQKRAAGKRTPFELYRIQLGKKAIREVRQAVENPLQRKGEIHALQRNPYTGDVVIPGSSVKGAMRTAVLSGNVNPGGQKDRRVESELAPLKGPRKARRLEELGFAYDPKHLEADPFRLVEVSDAAWPAGAVRIDRAEVRNPSRPETKPEGMQLHYERLLSEADNPEALPDCRLRIQLNEEALRDGRVKALIKRPIDWDKLANDCNTFFSGRFNAEWTTFETILPDRQRWYPEMQPGDILLRVGRHSHFDSLSVDNFRQGWNIQANKPIFEIGSTRTLCELAGGGWAPFGWVLLRPV